MAHPLIMYEVILITQHIPNGGSDSTRIVCDGFASVVSVLASQILGESIHNEIGIGNILFYSCTVYISHFFMIDYSIGEEIERGHE